MAIEKFEDLDVWREAMNLSKLLYRDLMNSKQFGLRDQIQRSAVSIPPISLHCKGVVRRAKNPVVSLQRTQDHGFNER